MIFFVRTHSDRTGAIVNVPFECELGSIEALESALKQGPVNGRQLIYDKLSDGRKFLKSRMALTLNDAIAIEVCRFVFVEAAE